MEWKKWIFFKFIKSKFLKKLINQKTNTSPFFNKKNDKSVYYFGKVKNDVLQNGFKYESEIENPDDYKTLI